MSGLAVSIYTPDPVTQPYVDRIVNMARARDPLARLTSEQESMAAYLLPEIHIAFYSSHAEREQYNMHDFPKLETLSISINRDPLDLFYEEGDRVHEYAAAAQLAGLIGYVPPASVTVWSTFSGAEYGTVLRDMALTLAQMLSGWVELICGVHPDVPRDPATDLPDLAGQIHAYDFGEAEHRMTAHLLDAAAFHAYTHHSSFTICRQ